MILPIYAFGHSILRKKTKNIDDSYSGLGELIDNMFETMHNANGVGLAAPQIGLNIRLFLVDTTVKEEKEGDEIKQVFINAELIEEFGESCLFEEGCLSIPKLQADVERLSHIKIKYYDENFEEHIKEFNGLNARVIQHEYDHIEGILFTDKLKPLKKRLIKRKLDKIKAGNIVPDYRMRFAK